VRDFWLALEYDIIPELLSRLKVRGHALMAKWSQNILLGKNATQKRSHLIINATQKRSHFIIKVRIV